jgi:hypothetical protein
MPYIENSEPTCGYRVKVGTRDAFRVAGYTRIVPPGRKGQGVAPAFWSEVAAWMCFELPADPPRDFWKDNPYKMMGPLGCRFHEREGDYSIGLHFDAYPPGHDDATNPAMEFQITVVRA